MSIVDGLPVNFTISDTAIAEIERVRALLKAESAANAVVVGIAWGFFKPKGHADFEGPAVGFYDEDSLENIGGGVETVSGLDVFFFILREHYANFAGKMLDFSAERMSFLRAGKLRESAAG